ncbi:hypothetical protein [Methylobacter sp.]|uniref:hypothetical protein n=1 Tax=Methylobacter sp. TaxID=2051955 RepID=UPI001227A16F|nr:hypothetical protein [Methylobacter sp.]TAK59490.1 MAG: hypothetical protein EPO18_20220 [Methylobacter sp.]
MTVIELRDKLIEEGIASAERLETGPKLKGALKGFEISRACATPEDFDRQLHTRFAAESKMIGSACHDTYWEHRYATLQIEFVYQRLKIAWNLPGPISAAAAFHYARIVGVKKEDWKTPVLKECKHDRGMIMGWGEMRDLAGNQVYADHDSHPQCFGCGLPWDHKNNRWLFHIGDVRRVDVDELG